MNRATIHVSQSGVDSMSFCNSELKDGLKKGIDAVKWPTTRVNVPG